ncbi:DUF799 family lipoprotein [Altererythrobacter sp. SALINAS58]|uniref:GNA1162 family protein n=1 Tax=Alteripontixanthobacter muriae TaxID=2705546 RepID=UPI001575AD5D|nr:GNA1162 family protein [Alteripontixanthobacter muriae]NTZ42887.1 DUF799 family lipoprotein [Alteripontixanthobacter muriae]
MKHLIRLAVLTSGIALAGCSSTPLEPKDYSSFHSAAPKSILVVPVVNHSNEVDASELFLTTMAVPLAERGYYVFPTNATTTMMNAEGLSDPGFVHQAPTPDLARLFGADAVLYVEVLDWDSNYKVVSSEIQTEFLYTLKSAKTGQVLWQDQQRYVHSTSSQSGNPLADLLANALTSVLNNTKSDFTPMAMQANIAVLSPAGQGLPFGHRNNLSAENGKYYPATGSGKISNAQREAMSAPGVRAPEAEIESD